MSVAAADPDAAEPSDSGSFLVSRTGDLSQSLTVTYAVSGSAAGGEDYQPLSGSVTIPAGLSGAPIDVVVIGDGVVEYPEDVTITLTAADGYAVGTPAAATVTLSDSGTVGDYVWFDADADGLQDPEENGISGVRVSLYAADGAFVSSQYTDAAGKYVFGNVAQGEYVLEFENPDPGTYAFTAPDKGADGIDSDAYPTGPGSTLATAGPFVPGAVAGDAWDCGFLRANKPPKFEQAA